MQGLCGVPEGRTASSVPSSDKHVLYSHWCRRGCGVRTDRSLPLGRMDNELEPCSGYSRSPGGLRALTGPDPTGASGPPHPVRVHQWLGASVYFHSTFCPLTLHSGGRPWLLEACGHGQAAGEVSDPRIIQVQAWGCRPSGAPGLSEQNRLLQEPRQRSAATANECAGECAGGTVTPASGSPSVIGPKQPGCLPSLGEGG